MPEKHFFRKKSQIPNTFWKKIKENEKNTKYCFLTILTLNSTKKTGHKIELFWLENVEKSNFWMQNMFLGSFPFQWWPLLKKRGFFLENYAIWDYTQKKITKSKGVPRRHKRLKNTKNRRKNEKIDSKWLETVRITFSFEKVSSFSLLFGKKSKT